MNEDEQPALSLIDVLTGAADVNYEAWQDGDLTDIEALCALSVLIEEAEAYLKPIEQFKELLRSQAGHILSHYGAPLELPGFGKLEITAPSLTKGYDRTKLDDLILALIKDGADDLARAIVACQTTSQRAGSLRIIREKPDRSA